MALLEAKESKVRESEEHKPIQLLRPASSSDRKPKLRPVYPPDDGRDYGISRHRIGEVPPPD